MKIVRHIAPDMRQALRSIREQLGEDAVILSSRRIPEGVEVTAAVDFDATSLQTAAMNAPAESVTAAALPAGARASPSPGSAVSPTHARAAAPPAADALPFAHMLASPARREPTLNISPPAKQDLTAGVIAELAPPPAPGAPGDAMGSELKTLRRMLETQLAQLAWNDLTRRAPVHVEILRELTEIGISQELSDYILKQLPEKVELGFARRFAIAGLSQYLLVTGDRWLENGGRVAFIGATGVGKTTTLAKLAVRWVLRHGARDLALVGSDTVRIGAQDQIQSLGQLLGVPVYTPENFESLPTLLSRLGDRHRLILIDTPGSSLRDAQLASRLGVLSNCASQMETTLVLAGSTQAGAIEETVKRFAPANPSCCVLTKLDEAASLGGALSALIRARLPVSYVSEGQRVPEDLRPARALELVSTAVRLAKASGAAADEDLLRRRFGKTAHAIT
jgi:flagellar biosynthesis protein FlhF